MMDHNQDETRLSTLNHQNISSVASSKQYSRFIRIARFVLPALAIIIMTLIFVWPDVESTIEPIAQSEILPDLETSQNQLIKARYESTDNDQQPFTITSQSAVQDPNNPMLVNLEKPTADLLLKDGAWLAAKSDRAIYEQNSEKLTLKGGVRLFHDAGYELQSEEMLVNIKTQSALSNQDVTAQGPEGVINAVGMDASGEHNVIVFNGPAKAELNVSSDAFNIGKAMPQ